MSDPTELSPTAVIFGRSTSHFTRVVTVFAHEMGVTVELVPLLDLGSLEVAHYGGNPALKIPSLRVGDSVLFGTDNVCRALAQRSTLRRKLVWPEDVHDERTRNAQQLAWHGMDAQVQLVAGPMLGKIDADNAYLAKVRRGFEGALHWLDLNVDHALGALPAPRDLSFFEVMLFCLVEHLRFRPTVPLAPYPRLTAFAADFGARPSALHTAYRRNSQVQHAAEGSHT